ncbi:MAG TPA: hypothetical protein VH814_13965 [Steroidobacteraceae bacterium]|jgi:hypothetical protein
MNTKQLFDLVLSQASEHAIGRIWVKVTVEDPEARERQVPTGASLSAPGADRSEVDCQSVARYECRARRGHRGAHEPSEIDGFRRQVKRDAFPLNAMNSLQDRYKLTEEEAAMALERICKARPAP